MPKYAILDIEADNLLDKLTTIHLVVVKDADTNQVVAFRDPKDACAYLDTFDRIVGHGIIPYDLPALKKIVGWQPKSRPIDTLLISRLLWPDRNAHPAGGSSLKCWGQYLGMPKGDFNDWSRWSPEMEAYCLQDVQITHAIFNTVMPLASQIPTAVVLEIETGQIIAKQVENGFGFDYKEASLLMADLQSKQAEVTATLQQAFPPKEIPMKTKVKLIPFNPGSRDMIAAALMRKYGWKPKQLTETGKPQIDESILKEMKYPEASLLSEYLLLDKRISQIAQWLQYGADGVVHGSVNTNGAVSGRMTHSEPNMAQVPRNSSVYGKECRSLFRPTRKDWLQVGADASGLELRMFAHYLAQFDGGAYGKIVCEGDIHSHNQAAAGLKTRDQAKTFIYGLLYGAGDEKVGTIVDGTRNDGARLKNDFKRQVPAYVKLLQQLEFQVAKNHSLRGLDGRPLPVRSPHSALNLLLQSAGAVVMKQALVFMEQQLSAQFPNQYAFMANIHDEVQIECPPDIAERCGEIMVDSIRKAGEHLKLKVALSGNYNIGPNWGATH